MNSSGENRARIDSALVNVAIAHDVLAARAGGERVVAALADLYPAATIHTLIHEPRETFTSLPPDRVEASWVNRISPIRRRYRAVLPVAALTFAATTLDADVTICSTSGLSHHVRTTGAKLVYCHTPARWIHDADTYMQGFGKAVTVGAAVLRPAMARLDRHAMRGADTVVANSSQIAGEIRSVYGITATVIRPCSTLDIDGPTQAIPNVEPGFVLSPARPLAYKRVELLVEAARRLPNRRFLHIGDGPHRHDLTAGAPSNFASVGAVSDDQLRWAYQHAELVALTCAEDFGLVPLEAAAHGLSTVAPAARGLLDHTTSTLLTYPFGSADALVEAIQAAPAPTGGFHHHELGRDRFNAEISAAVKALT